MHIAIIGAFDRFNYGDLVFPLVLKAFFEREAPNHKLRFAGLRAQDLREWGGVRAEPLETFLQPGSLPDHSAVVLAGGEILGATWFKLFRYLQPARSSMAWRAAARGLPDSWLDQWARRRLNSRRPLPFVLSPDHFPGRVRLAYNAVGGTSMSGLPARLRAVVQQSLGQAAYATVRDRLSLACTRMPSGAEPATLAPDSAAAMAHYFPANSLPGRMGSAGRQALSEIDGDYVCIQVADDHVRGREAVLARQLDRIQAETGSNLVLLPIGRAAGHEDDQALMRVQRAMARPALLPNPLGVFDIMALIAFARAFVGTSLHGNITAMAYGVPHLGLTRRVPKLTAYLDTWARPESKTPAPLDALAPALGRLLSKDPRDRVSKGRGLADQAVRNLQEMNRKLTQGDT